MKAMSSTKTQQLVLVVLLTGGLLSGLWFGLIVSQKEKLHSLAQRKAAAQGRMQQVKETIARADQIETQFCDSRKRS